MATFGSVVEKQNNIYGLIARSFDNVKKLGSDKVTRHYLDARLKSLDANWERFHENHDKLVGALTEEISKHIYFTDDLYSTCEEAYCQSRANIMVLRDTLMTKSDDSGGSKPNSSICRALPKISLPRFSGEYHEWPSFRDLFKSMVILNKDVSAVEKLHYLKSQVTGEAARYIANIPVTSENFSRAWEALTARYDNKRVILTTYLDRLFSIKPIAQKSSAELKSLLATVKEVLGAMQSLGTREQQRDVIIVYFISRRLDARTLEEWELDQGTSHEFAKFNHLELFLEKRVRALESVQSRAQATTSTQQKFSPKPKTSARAHAAVVNSASCSCCGASHYISSCAEFASKSLSERQDIVSKKSLCFNCLGAHRLNECRSLKRCRKCKSQHHTLLHRDVTTSNQASHVASTSTSAPATESAPVSQSSGSSTTTAVYSHTAAAHQKSTQILLATACVTLVNPRGASIKLRALLDQGSEISLIKESLIQLLRIPRARASVPIMGVGDHHIGSSRGVVALTLRSHYDPSIEFTVSAFVIPKVTGRIPARPVTASWSHLTNLQLADPEFASPGPIDIILGADVYGALLLGEIRRGPLSAPVAQHTSLGWIVSGPVNAKATSCRPSSFVSCCQPQEADLQDALQQFWVQEDIRPSILPSLTPDKKACEDHFRNTHSRDETGRYTVRLPFRSSTNHLGDSLPAARRSFARMRQRIQGEEAFGQLYTDFMEEYEALGHMIPASSSPKPNIHLPHHGVLRETSSTTKLRVVFNGSARTSTGLSLNDCLHAGPKLQQDLDAVILRWRTHAVAFAADIEKMYRQIALHREDRQFQQILWSTTDTPRSYQLTTVTYGLTCAPYLALRALQQLATDEELAFPHASEIVRKAMYVDDVLSGADNPQDAKFRAIQLVQLLKAGGFKLQKWSSNCEEIFQKLSDSSTLTSIRELQSEARTLGLTWQPAF